MPVQTQSTQHLWLMTRIDRYIGTYIGGHNYMQSDRETGIRRRANRQINRDI